MIRSISRSFDLGRSTVWNFSPVVRSAIRSQAALRVRDEKGRTWQTISDSVERRLCESDGRQFGDSDFFERKWPPSKCRRAYLAYKRILREEGGRFSKNARSR
jgi:hypothetical protein